MRDSSLRFFSTALALFLLTAVRPALSQLAAPPQLPAKLDSSAAKAPTALPAQAPAAPEEFNLAVGYNLKVNVRMAPVYKDSILTSPLLTYLAKGSVVAVVSELDNWYKIEFGEKENRRQGWVISYGVERTHELEHIVTSREEVNRWEGKKIIVIAGETAVRSFPAAGAEMLIRTYRNEIFNLAGESEDYFMVQLPNAVRGWIWKGDVEPYVQPKYSGEEVRAMKKSARENQTRLQNLENLLGELDPRRRKTEEDLAILRKLQEETQAKAAAAVRRKVRKPLFHLDSLKARSSLNAGLQYQKFGGKMGLSTTILKGFGYSYRGSDKLTLGFSYFSGSPAVRAIGSAQAPLPGSLTGLDSLKVSAGFWQFGLSYAVGGLQGVPLLKRLNNQIYLGMGRLTLKPTAAGLSESQVFWGPILGWGFGGRLFGRLSFDMGLNFFITRGEVTDVRTSGPKLLQTEKVFFTNPSFHGGMLWRL